MEDKRLQIAPQESALPSEYAPAYPYLSRIRPQWQSTQLIKRVARLLPVDASCACQRLLNAATHDLRLKVRTIGLDLARDVAVEFKLPPVTGDEALEDYPTARLFDLAYRIGLLTRPEWRRLHRAYEIRRDLEHEDDEYEATPGDLIYIFETAIDVVLSREPVQVLRLQDISDVVESESPISVTQELIDDYECAPPQRQSEIFVSVTFGAIDPKRPEVVQSNCFRVLRKFAPITPPKIKIELAGMFETRIGRREADIGLAQVAVASGAYPFIHRRQQRTLNAAFLSRFSAVTPAWRQHPEHGELLDYFLEAGGFSICPPSTEGNVIRWLITAYIGEPGRSGFFGRNRPVFYSDTAAPRIEAILRAAPSPIKDLVMAIANEPGIRKLIQIPEQQARLDNLIGLTSSSIPNVT